MKLLKEIKDKEIPQGINPKLKSAARAIIFDDENKVPLAFAEKIGVHKIPGGEIEKGETNEEALAREIKEEAGCTAEITKELGKITEYRSKWNLLQTSYCYLGKVIEKGEQNLTEKEKQEGFKLIWVPVDEAISLVKNDKPIGYEAGFIKQRELIFLEEAKKKSPPESV